jgi:hypothetical protein
LTAKSDLLVQGLGPLVRALAAYRVPCLHLKVVSAAANTSWRLKTSNMKLSRLMFISLLKMIR